MINRSRLIGLARAYRALEKKLLSSLKKEEEKTINFQNQIKNSRNYDPLTHYHGRTPDKRYITQRRNMTRR